MTIYRKIRRSLRSGESEVVHVEPRPGISIGVEGYDVLDEAERTGNVVLRRRGVPMVAVLVEGLVSREDVLAALTKVAEKDAEVRRLYDAENRLLASGERTGAAKVAHTRIMFRAAYDQAIREAMGITPRQLVERGREVRS